jgi:hypothetical protein
MIVCGADFSGARDPSRGIYYAKAEIEDNIILINEVVHCDDRLDLFCAISRFRCPWGVDFPFSIPRYSFELLGINSWEQLLGKVSKLERDEFKTFLNGVGSQERRCSVHSEYCRISDAVLESFSPFKENMPNMKGMIYGGLRFLNHLRQAGHYIFPFDVFNKDMSRIYEVYPSHTWKALSLERSTDLSNFKSEIETCGLTLEIPEHIAIPNKDAADAVVACVTLASNILYSDIEKDWAKILPGISQAEWDLRNFEGLIVRLKDIFK